MTLPPPPLRPPGTPVLVDVPRGTVLVRVHGSAYRAEAFNPVPRPSVGAGGRFDSVDGSYDYAYLGDGPAAAIAETLMRDMPMARADRVLRSEKLIGRHLSRVRTLRALSVVDLRGAALNHLGATLDLTKCGPEGYITTRGWAAAIRIWCPAAAGLVYRPRHDEDAIAYALFDDGSNAQQLRARGALEAMNEPGLSLASSQGLRAVRSVAVRHDVSVASAGLPVPSRPRPLP